MDNKQYFESKLIEYMTLALKAAEITDFEKSRFYLHKAQLIVDLLEDLDQLRKGA